MEADESRQGLARRERMRIALCIALGIVGMLPLVASFLLIPSHPGWALGLMAGYALVALVVGSVMTGRAATQSASMPIDEHCQCGYGLCGAPPRSESRHEFDVHGRMDAIKRTFVCPECGRDFVGWTDAPPGARRRVVRAGRRAPRHQPRSAPSGAPAPVGRTG